MSDSSTRIAKHIKVIAHEDHFTLEIDGQTPLEEWAVTTVSMSADPDGIPEVTLSIPADRVTMDHQIERLS